ncbi:MAG: hypothetical protein ACRDID_19290, partial [Ktedonobacterales bacterium]
MDTPGNTPTPEDLPHDASEQDTPESGAANIPDQQDSPEQDSSEQDSSDGSDASGAGQPPTTARSSDEPLL